MKLLVDLNVSPGVAAILRSAGHEVVRAGEALDPRATDEEITAYAADGGWVVVSQDQDFSALLAASGAAAPSLVNLRLSVVEAGALAAFIDAVVHQVADDLATGAIVTVTDAGVRVRRLPIG